MTSRKATKETTQLLSGCYFAYSIGVVPQIKSYSLKNYFHGPLCHYAQCFENAMNEPGSLKGKAPIWFAH
jgi:hypothetical protein